MLKKLLFYLIIISFCFIIVSCEKRAQTRESDSNVDGTIISMILDAETSQTNISSEPETETDNSIIPTNSSEPFIGHLNLDSETENFLYGTWQVEKLLGFANSYNEASEYPTGQNIIGDEIIIEKDFFSSNGLKNYSTKQYITRDPLYEIDTICYNSDSFYRLFKIDLPGLNLNDEVKWLNVYLSSTEHGLSIPVTFFAVNNDRLILLLEATCFELKKVVE